MNVFVIHESFFCLYYTRDNRNSKMCLSVCVCNNIIMLLKFLRKCPPELFAGMNAVADQVVGNLWPM